MPGKKLVFFIKLKHQLPWRKVMLKGSSLINCPPLCPAPDSENTLLPTQSSPSRFAFLRLWVLPPTTHLLRSSTRSPSLWSRPTFSSASSIPASELPSCSLAQCFFLQVCWTLDNALVEQMDVY